MITVTWDNAEKTIVRLDYADPVKTWDEYHAAVAESNALAQTVSHPVDLIHNPGATKMPPGNALMQISRAMRAQPDNVGSIYMVVKDSLARRILETLMRLFVTRNMHFADTLEEARERSAASVQKIA